MIASTSTILSSLGISAAQTLALSDVGRLFYDKGWSYGTSCNFSVVAGRDPLRILITASGRDKGRLSADDFTLVSADGIPVDSALPKPSAETLLHVAAAECAGAGAVLHTHSIWGTLLSEMFVEQGELVISGYEMLKGFEGIVTHEASKRVEIFENMQDISSLTKIVRTRMNDRANPLRHGFLISGHGLYAWGRDLTEARRHIEVFEFLFEVLGRKLAMTADVKK